MNDPLNDAIRAVVREVVREELAASQPTPGPVRLLSVAETCDALGVHHVACR